MSPAEVRARVAETRTRQGFGPTITDPDTLRQLAAPVVDVLVRQKGGADERAGGGSLVAGTTRRRQPQTRTTGRVAGADGEV
jgi:hypothetical protein